MIDQKKIDTRPYIEFFLGEEKEKEFADLYLNGYNIEQLSEHFGLSKKKTKRLLKILQIKRNVKQIQRPEKLLFKNSLSAYYTGLLCTRIRVNRYSVFPKYEIVFTEDLKDMILQAMEYLDYNGTYGYDKSTGRYWIFPNNRELINILDINGFSLHGQLRFSYRFTGTLARDFMRGYIDGGGGVINSNIGYMIVYGARSFLTTCFYHLGWNKNKVNINKKSNYKYSTDRYFRVRIKKSLDIINFAYYDGCATIDKNMKRVEEFRKRFGNG